LSIKGLQQGCYLGRAHKQRSVPGIIPFRGRSDLRRPDIFGLVTVFVGEKSQIVYSANPLLESAEHFRADFQLSIVAPLVPHAPTCYKNRGESASNREKTPDEGSKESLHAASVPASRS